MSLCYQIRGITENKPKQYIFSKQLDHNQPAEYAYKKDDPDPFDNKSRLYDNIILYQEHKDLTDMSIDQLFLHIEEMLKYRLFKRNNKLFNYNASSMSHIIFGANNTGTSDKLTDHWLMDLYLYGTQYNDDNTKIKETYYGLFAYIIALSKKVLQNTNNTYINKFFTLLNFCIYISLVYISMYAFRNEPFTKLIQQIMLLAEEKHNKNVCDALKQLEEIEKKFSVTLYLTNFASIRAIKDNQLAINTYQDEINQYIHEAKSKHFYIFGQKYYLPKEALFLVFNQNELLFRIKNSYVVFNKLDVSKQKYCMYGLSNEKGRIVGIIEYIYLVFFQLLILGYFRNEDLQSYHTAINKLKEDFAQYFRYWNILDENNHLFKIINIIQELINLYVAYPESNVPMEKLSNIVQKNNQNGVNNDLCLYDQLCQIVENITYKNHCIDDKNLDWINELNENIDQIYKTLKDSSGNILNDEVLDKKYPINWPEQPSTNKTSQNEKNYKLWIVGFLLLFFAFLVFYLYS
jgi:hypothetical protein